MMTRRSFLQSLGASLIVVAVRPVPEAFGVLAPSRSDTAWLDLANGCAFVYTAQVVAPQHRAHYLSKARLCLIRYKETII